MSTFFLPAYSLMLHVAPIGEPPVTTFAGIFAAHKVYDANPKRCIMGIQVSIYKNSFDTTGVSVSLSAVVNRIRSGAKGLAETTGYCQITSATDPDKYRTYKASQLPAVTFSGVFPTNQRKAHAIAHHSGLITLDIDGLNPADIGYILTALASMPEVLIAFVSPSGAGIKAVVSVDPIPVDAIEHKGAWQACADRLMILPCSMNSRLTYQERTRHGCVTLRMIRKLSHMKTRLLSLGIVRNILRAYKPPKAHMPVLSIQERLI